MNPDGPTQVSGWRSHGLEIDPDRILRVHGYSDPARRVRRPIHEAAVRASLNTAALAAPEASHMRRAILRCEGGELEIEGGHSFSCPAFDRLLAGCTHVDAFVLTLGPGIETAVAELNEKSEMLDALFYETAGWLLIEQASRQLGAELRARADGEGMAVMFRIGPGYDYRGDEDVRVRWDLEQQRELFAMFRDAPLPVELLESCVMLPRMSRSGLFGLRPKLAL